jgi:membrane-associated phospholipid phosphatase
MSGGLFNKFVAGILLLIVSGALLNGVGHLRIGGAIEAIAIFIFISIGGMFASVVLASTNLPYADQFLISMDALLGFHWLPVYQFFRSEPQWYKMASLIYFTIQWQPFLLIGILFLFNRADICWLFLRAWLFSLLATLTIFPLFPAVGGAAYYSAGPVVAGSTPLTWVEVLGQSREGLLRILDERSLVGLIAFPSFHAASAMLLGWAFFQLPYLRWPFVVLNILMALSAIIIGDHYLVDIIAGMLIGLLGIAGAGRVERYLNKR